MATSQGAAIALHLDSTANGNLAAESDALTRLHELGMRLAGPVEIGQALDDILQTITEIHNAAGGLLSLYDASLGTLCRCSTIGFDKATCEALGQVTAGPEAGPCGAAFASGRRVIVEDTESDAKFAGYREFARQAGFRAVHSTPIVARNGDVLGVLSVQLAERRRPTRMEMQTADMCARHAAEIVELSRSKEGLGESERRFRQIIDALPVAIYTTDAEGRLTHFNPAATEFAGRVPQLGTDRWCVSWKLYRPDGTSLPHEECPMAITLKEGRVVRGAEAIIERPDGKRIHFEPYPALLRDAEGRITGGVNMLVDVTERKRAEAAKNRLAAIVESSDDAIISKNLDGIIQTWNSGATRLFGYAAEEVIGKPVTILIPADHIDEEPYILERIRHGEPVQNYETVRHRKDGTLVDISLTVSPIFDGHGKVEGASKIARDISAFKRTEKALRENEELFRALANTIPNLAWMADADGYLFWYNNRWYEYTGATPEEMEGWGWQKVHDPEKLPQVMELWKRSIATGQEFTMTFPLRRADGRFRSFLTRAIPVRGERGKIVRWFGTNTDISEQTEMEDALLRVNERLRRANCDLEQFAYSATHDLQEPVRNIAVYGELIRRRYAAALDADGMEFLAYMTAGARRLELLIKDLLAYTQLARAPEEAPESTDAADALAGALGNLSDSIREANAEVTFDSLPKLRVREIELRQLFQNLIGNAIKYRRREEPPRIHVSAERDREMWRFSVRDNGIGIAPEYSKTVFGMFKRLHAESEYPGTGIGLAICQKIVERHGGRIWVESEIEEGATFMFTFPTCNKA
jgi:PAS domain S-box-containing protein